MAEARRDQVPAKFALASIAAGMLLGLAQPATAQTCQTVEYVEAKDWSAEQVERAYCADLMTASKILAEEARLLNSSGNVRAIERELGPLVNQCSKQLALYERILKNRFGRVGPYCGKPAAKP